MTRTLVFAAVGFALLAAPHPRTARAQATIPVMKIRVGDRGYCLTVFHGLKPERFRFRVKGILFNYFPRQHLILIESQDPKLKLSGVVAGMSGSPCFVQGKLAGALAYGPNWSKTPIAMLTPIQNMLDELKRPLRGIKRSPALNIPTKRSPRVRLSPRSRRILAWKDESNPLSPFYRSLPAPLSARLLPNRVASMRRLQVPLSVSGFDALTLKEMRKDLSPFGFSVIQGGGASSASALKYYRQPKRFVAGGSIGVQLMSGAMSMNGTGTVTHVVGDKVLAFGHPMANWGEHYIPVTTSWIHMFVSSVRSSYKISTALKPMGSLILDRRACIVAQAGLKAPTIPVRVEIASKSTGRKDYSFRVFSNRTYSPFYISYAVRAILRKLVPDDSDATISARFSFDTIGAGTVTMDDYAFAQRGAAMSWSVGYLRGFRILRFMLFQPFKKVQVKAIRIRAQVEYKRAVARITDLRLGSTTAAPGEIVSVRVTLRRRYKGGRYVQVIPFTVPTWVPSGTVLRLDVSSGPMESIDMAPPESMRDVLRVIKRMHHARQLVLRVRLPGEGTSIHGRIVRDLPGSVLDSLRSGSSAKSRLRHKVSIRKIVNLSDVIQGRRQIYLRVRRP